MTDASAKLQNALRLEQTADFIFSGDNDGFELPNPYGGRLLGQAASAAGQTLADDRYLHSMHASFMRTGKRDLPIEYHVQALRDGRNFNSRRVEALQSEKLLFSCICGYHTYEPNVDAQLTYMPDVPAAETLLSNAPWQEVAHYERRAQQNPHHPIRSFDLRFVPDAQNQTLQTQPVKRQLWVKYLGDGGNPREHEALFAWLSDFFLLPMALKPLGIELVDRKLRIASLDHALWIHRPLDLSEWLLFDYQCTSYAHSRAHTEAKVYDVSGQLVASLAQEGLLQIQPSEA